MGKYVMFQMPDGSEVSNDPRWLAERQMSLTELQIEGTENTGYATPHVEDENLTIGGGNANEGNTLSTPITGVMVQTADAKAADDAGYDADNPKHLPDEPEDKNEKVLEAREARKAKAQAEYEATMAANDEVDEVGDPDEEYENWSAAALKNEVKKRKEAGRTIDTAGVTKKAQLAELLNADDQAADEEAASAASQE